ncbi:MAG: hypothetical protein US96_C0012G0014 [Candidatus Woesebacteria bacterium GW2011_GWB1_38_5b]|uniref:Nudix hydrolase domain-containing protein n=1 Tax=Candidatus Woesebacteria bacterium GW2011_GWB1_38_5b TaxID=1618569 RepID=A0A0G0KIN6_9BACT|nr:MAG: hypothetical protein US96_C0012G0014 [Candidatus Woesebacteria bacterium GW2011_GWB1_38_5b]
MIKHQKVAVIVWAMDPEGKKRFLLRHNKPFNGYEDEWTVAFGDIEKDENMEGAAKREVFEEYGISDFEDFKDLNYKVENISFLAVKVKNLDVKITLNEESIGYDWMIYEKVMEIMKHEDEAEAFGQI